MLEAAISWAVSSWQNLVFLTGLAGSVLGLGYLWIKDKIKDFKHARQLRAVKKDLDIANKPPKRGDDLIDGL